MPLLIAAGVFGLILLALAARIRHGARLPAARRSPPWVALFESGIDPVVARPRRSACSPTPIRPARDDLERATRPVPPLPRAADARAGPLGAASGLQSAVSPNERLQQLYHPWTSYVIVPLFALANAGIAIDGDFLSRAVTSPITLGILFGYVLGKPLGIAGVVLAGRPA